jgi:hypothetical protein
MVVYICTEMCKTFLQLLITNLASHTLEMELCNIRAYSQSRYPIGKYNGKKTTKDYFGFLLHLLFHDYIRD